MPPPAPAPIVYIARPDGSPMANIWEMDELVRRAWGPINRKFADDLEPGVEAIVAKYPHHLYRVPRLADPPMANWLRKHLWAMSPSAMGLDGWSCTGFPRENLCMNTFLL